jgi:hypothetical protein
MRKLFLALFTAAILAPCALAQSQGAPTLRIVSEDGNNLPSELLYGNTRVKPLRLRPGTNQPITIDDADFFVQQQYVDFFSRFPDQPGFQFWLGQIANCNPKPGCTDGQRTNTSGAFFLSIEFQETGYLVYKTYGAAFGTTRVGGTVPVTFQEFLPDTRTIGKNVIVNQGDWQGQIEANKVAFFNAFVARSQFTSAYPSSMSAAQFVDALNANTGNSLTSAERDSLVSQLGSGAKTRAQVLRAVAENQTFSTKEKNRAFVLMQYFGYLRRNPFDSPDSDFQGYNFWLTKLNNHGGDFHAAEMVRSFLVSSEYTTRF